MLASLRAELLILRKWPVAWGLLLVTPALTVITNYLLPFVQYKTVTPDQYGALGSPSQILPTILPGQYVIVAVSNFGFSGTAPFVVLGALLAGGDWGRGTIKTALLAGPGRVRNFAGQLLAMVIALAASVLLTFLLAGLASAVIAALATGPVSPADSAFPAVSVLVRAILVAVLVSACYGSAGLLLGTLFRSVGGAIAAALLWTVVIQAVLDNLALQAGGILQAVNNALPNASAVSITSIFGAIGGGAETSQYYRVAPALSIWVLLAYTAAFLGVAAILLRSRDVGVQRSSRTRRRQAGQAARRSAGAAGQPVPAAAARATRRHRSGLLTALRAELLVMRRWPTVWAFVLVLPVYTVLDSYLVQYVFYKTAGSGVFAGLSPDDILPKLLPGQFVNVSLAGFGFNGGFDGTAPFLLIGALIAGSDWGRDTIKTSLAAGPSRLRTSLAQTIAVMLALAASVLATFLLAAASSMLVALVETGSVAPATSQFPALDTVVRGLGSGLLVSVAYGAAGLTLGALLRNPGGAIAAALLWAVILRSLLDNLAVQLHGTLQILDKVLPNASTTTLTHLFDTGSTVGIPIGARVDTGLACLVLGGYLVVFIAVPALLTRFRDVV